MTIRNEPLLEALLSDAREKGQSDEDVEAYRGRWNQLSSDQQVPCPVCSAKGKEQLLSLQPRRDDAQSEPMTCPACRSEFAIPIS